MNDQQAAQLMPSLARYMTATHRFDHCIDTSTSVGELAIGLANFQDEAAASTLKAFGPFLTDTTSLQAWLIDVENLRAHPNEQAIWQNLHIAMLAITDVYPKLWDYCGVHTSEYMPAMEYHAKNTQHFAELCALSMAGKIQPLDAIVPTLRWCSERGSDLSRQAVITLYSTFLPDKLPELLSIVRAG